MSDGLGYAVVLLLGFIAFLIFQFFRTRGIGSHPVNETPGVYVDDVHVWAILMSSHVAKGYPHLGKDFAVAVPDLPTDKMDGVAQTIWTKSTMNADEADTHEAQQKLKNDLVAVAGLDKGTAAALACVRTVDCVDAAAVIVGLHQWKQKKMVPIGAVRA